MHGCARRLLRAVLHPLPFFNLFSVPTCLPKENLHLTLDSIHHARLDMITRVRVAARPPFPLRRRLPLLLLLRCRCPVGILTIFRQGNIFRHGSTRRRRRRGMRSCFGLSAALLSSRILL